MNAACDPQETWSCSPGAEFQIDEAQIDEAVHGIDVPDRPAAHGPLSMEVRRRLRTAFKLAVERVSNVASCGRLFTDLGADGLELLAQTEYVAATRADEKRPRLSSSAAFTYLHSPRTYLLREFGRLRWSAGAVILIHEALHFAGLGEAPSDPAGLTGEEINRLVAERCAL